MHVCWWKNEYGNKNFEKDDIELSKLTSEKRERIKPIINDKKYKR